MAPIVDLLDDLRIAARRLEASGGLVARRNARLGFFGRLRALKAWVDRSYPPITRTGRPVRYSNDSRARRARAVKRLVRTGYVPIGDAAENADLLVTLAAGGVRVVRGADGRTWIPHWAVLLRNDPPKLRRAARSLASRRALVAEASLAQDQEAT